MKKILMLICMMATTAGMVKSQEYIPTTEEVEHFYSTKTLVVMEDNPLSEFNFVIKGLMKQEWKITPYDFINRLQFEEMRFDKKYSFLMLSQVKFDKDKLNAKYIFLSIVLGSNEKIVGNMPDLCPIPMAYAGVDEDSYTYKLGIFIAFMQKHIDLLRKNPNMLKANLFKHYNSTMSDIKSKTLYIVENELAKDINTEAKLKKIYPYNIKIVTRDEITKAIEENNENIVFLHKVGPEGTRFQARCYKIFIGAADANFYYFHYHNIDDKNPDGLLSADIKRLAKRK